MARLEAADQPVAASVPASPPVEIMRVVQVSPPPPVGAPVHHREVLFTAARKRIGVEEAFTWGGVALVVLAVGFAASTAISKGWVGPILQLIGAVALSLFLIVVGLRFRARRPRWSTALASGGVAGLYATFASSLFFQQTNDVTSYVMVSVVAVLALLLMYRARLEWLAVVIVGGGAVAYLVVDHWEQSDLRTVIGLVALVGLARGVAAIRRWTVARVVVHGLGLLIMVIAAGQADAWSVRVVVVLGALGVMASLVTVAPVDPQRWAERVENQLLALTGGWALLVAFMTSAPISRHEAGWIAAGVAAGWLGCSLLLGRRLGRNRWVSMLLGSSLAASVSLLLLLLHWELLFVGLAVQGLGLVVLARNLDGNRRVFVYGSLLLGVVSFRLLFGGINAWFDELSVGDNVVRVVMLVLLGIAVRALRPGRVRNGLALSLVPLLMVTVAALFVHGPQGQATVSVIWAVIGAAAFVVGASRRLPELGGVGLAALAVTVAKLLVIDMAEVEALWRALLFLLVGLGLIRLGIMLPKLKPAPTPE